MAEHHSFQGLPDGEPVEGRTFRADGWAYVDMPAWALQSWWDKARALFGEGEYFVLAESSMDGYWRGQLLLSPLAVDKFISMRTQERGRMN